MEQRLDLAWNVEPARQPEPSTRIDGVPGADDLAALADLVQMGYLRGIRARLVQIGATQAGCAGFVAQAQALAAAFALDGLATLVRQAQSMPDTAQRNAA